MTDWSGIGPAAITGFGGSQPGGGSGGVQSGVAGAVATKAAADAPLYSPQNPLFWFGAFLVGGAIFFHLSTHVKAGKAEASLNL
jgi:hypothetical protein